jgi:hypothetical protein
VERLTALLATVAKYAKHAFAFVNTVAIVESVQGIVVNTAKSVAVRGLHRIGSCIHNFQHGVQFPRFVEYRPRAFRSPGIGELGND